MDSVDLLSVEARASRIAAILDTRPGVGRLWRTCVTLVESSSTLAVEDVRIAESSVAIIDGLPPSQNDDPQAVAVAREIASVLRRPGDLFEHPRETILRCLDASRMSSLVDVDLGGRASWAGREFREDWSDAVDRIVEAAPPILNHHGPILLKLIALASEIHAMLPEPVPMAERLIFMLADHALRRREALPFLRRFEAATPDAFWVFSPGAALLNGGLRNWSPESRAGRAALVSSLDRTLRRDMGLLGRLHAWQEDLTRFAGARTRAGARARFADFLATTPMVSGLDVAAACDMTDRSARNMIAAAEEAGLLRLITPRPSYRIYASPVLAEMIQDRDSTVRSRGPEMQTRTHATDPDEASSRLEQPDFSSALDYLDEQIAAADRILAKYAHRPKRNPRDLPLSLEEDID